VALAGLVQAVAELAPPRAVECGLDAREQHPFLVAHVAFEQRAELAQVVLVRAGA